MDICLILQGICSYEITGSQKLNKQIDNFIKLEKFGRGMSKKSLNFKLGMFLAYMKGCKNHLEVQ